MYTRAASRIRTAASRLLAALLLGLTPAALAQTTYEAALSGAEELPPVLTDAAGALTLSRAGDQVIVTGSFEGLGSAYTASHLHLGYAGASGPVLLPLSPTVDTEGRGGVFEAGANTFTLGVDQLAALDERRVYVNVHSETHPSGEIRGQVLPESDAHLTGRLLSRNQATYTLTPGSGGVAVEIDGSTAVLTGSFQGTEGPVFAAHFHFGRVGHVVEPPMIVLAMELADEGHSGVFTAAANTYELTPEQRHAFLADSVYVNVHSEAHGVGELRAQVLAAPNRAPAPPLLTEPADGTTLDIAGAPSTRLRVAWDAAADPDGHPLTYVWELARGPDFAAEDVVFGRVVAATSFELLTYLALAQVGGVAPGEIATLYHRVLASDGSALAPSDPFALTLDRRGGTSADAGAYPAPLALDPPYPNPASGALSLPYRLPEAGPVSLALYDLLGRRVATLVSAIRPAGPGVARLERGALAAGVYVCRLAAGGRVVTRRVTLSGS